MDSIIERFQDLNWRVLRCALLALAVALGAGTETSDAAVYRLACSYVSQQDVFESNARTFLFDTIAKTVEIYDDKNNRNWVFRPQGHPDALGILDDSLILDMDGGNIHKLVAFASVATVPNMIEAYLTGSPAKLRWVYIMGGDTADLVFVCKS